MEERGVGKTHLIRSCEAHWQPLLWFDLLDYELYRTLISDPSLFVRQVEGFSRFPDIAAQYHGKIPNMSRIARAAGIFEKRVAAYFQILEDTLMCWRLPGWSESPTKLLRISLKLYLFDNVVANALKGELALIPRKGTSRYGDLFEAWIVQEAFRAIDYKNLELKLSYWQTNTDQEVDLIVSRGLGEPLLAVEIKSETAPRYTDVRGLKSFAADYPATKLQCWCQTRTRYLDNGVEFLPWREGLAGLKTI